MKHNNPNDHTLHTNTWRGFNTEKFKKFHNIEGNMCPSVAYIILQKFAKI